MILSRKWGVKFLCRLSEKGRFKVFIVSGTGSAKHEASHDDWYGSRREWKSKGGRFQHRLECSSLCQMLRSFQLS